MTDGPYAPPSMSRQWKKFARTLGLAAFEEERSSRLKEAVIADARRECVGEAVAFVERQFAIQAEDLFGTDPQGVLEIARERYPTPMAQSAFDNCEHALRLGAEPFKAIQDGVAGALRERAWDGCHSIEAYTMQKEGFDAAQDAQIRCNEMLPKFDWSSLVTSVRGDGPANFYSSNKSHNRLEEGPPL